MKQKTAKRIGRKFGGNLNVSDRGFSIDLKSKRTWKHERITVYSIEEVMDSEEALSDSYNPRGNLASYIIYGG